MTRDSDADIEKDAADWHAQILGGDVDWTAFALWLDAHPAHQPAYDRLALLDAEVTHWTRQYGLPAMREEEPEDRAGVSRRWWLGGAVAASLTALAIGVPQMMSENAGALTVHATTVELREIALADNGGAVMLDRNSQLALSSNGQVRMDKGAAYFDVRHDASRPLEIHAGDFVVRDIGTRFTVTRTPERLFVAVEEGLVDISWQDSPPARLKAGQAFEGEERNGRAEIHEVDPGTVGSWRDGRLVYDNAPLDKVALDLSRTMGTVVEVDPSVAHLKLSGILLIRNGFDLADQISAILPVEVRRGNGRIRLVARGHR